MQLNRRDALLALATSMAAGVSVPVSAQQTIPRELFDQVANLLIPADEMSPGASQLGVVDDVYEMVAGHPMLQQLFSYGFGWLDQVAGQPFLSLPALTQHQILSAASQSDYNQIPGRFFHVLRLFVIEVYFGHPEAVAGLPINPAPQPDGYLPPWT